MRSSLQFFQVPYQMAGGQVCPGVCKAAKLDVPMECPLTRLDLTEQVHQKINAVTRLVPLHAYAEPAVPLWPKS